MLQCVITTGLTSEGQITDATGVASGALTFTATPAQTVTLTPGANYFYDVQVKLDDASITTIEGGTITLEQGVTAATS